METKIKDYRYLLHEEFASRRKRNLGYSLRAFARDIDMPAPKLSQILRGLCGLSGRSAHRIATKLKFSSTETQWFILSVEAEHNRNPKLRGEAQQKLTAFEKNRDFDEINIERFRVISDWYHFALLELTELESFQSDPKWVAQQLGISKTEAQNAVQRLLDFGLLEQNPKTMGWRQTKKYLATPSGIPSREIRKHHTQILMKALASIDDHDVKERDLSSITMAFSQSQFTEAQKLIKEFRRKFDRLMKETQDPKDRVYNLAIQFFPLNGKGEQL